MKKIKMAIQEWLFDFCLSFSQRHRLMYGQSIAADITYNFFYHLGRKMLIIRDGEVHYLGTTLSVEARFDTKNNLLYCKPMCRTVQEGDIVFYGKNKVYREYEKYRYTGVDFTID